MENINNNQPQTQTQPQQTTQTDNSSYLQKIAELEAKNKELLETLNKNNSIQNNKNDYENYKETIEKEAKNKAEENFLVTELSNILPIYNSYFKDGIDRLQKMDSLTTKQKIETMARELILKAKNNSEETKKQLKELENTSILDKNGALKYMYDEAIKTLKNTSFNSKTTNNSYFVNRLTEEDLKQISAGLFGENKAEAKKQAKEFGLIN